MPSTKAPALDKRLPSGVHRVRCPLGDGGSSGSPRKWRTNSNGESCRKGNCKGRKPYRSTHGALLLILRAFGLRVGGTRTVVFKDATCSNSTSRRCSHCCALTCSDGKVRIHSANKTSLLFKLIDKFISSTAPRKVPFISMSVIMRPDAARCCSNLDFPSIRARSVCILSTHFRTSIAPARCRLLM